VTPTLLALLCLGFVLLALGITAVWEFIAGPER
jgi:hypothetical protein